MVRGHIGVTSSEVSAAAVASHFSKKAHNFFVPSDIAFIFGMHVYLVHLRSAFRFRNLQLRFDKGS